MKQTALTGALVLLIAYFLIACASTSDDTLDRPSATQSAAAVPGEKMSDEGRYAPGPMGSSSVRW